MKRFKSQRKFSMDWIIYGTFSILFSFSILSFFYPSKSSSLVISILELVLIITIIIPIWSLLHITYLIKDEILIIRNGIFIKKILINTIQKIKLDENHSSIGLLGQMNTFKAVIIYYGEKNQTIDLIPNDISMFIENLKDINNKIFVQKK